MYENDEERCMDVYKKNKSLSSLGNNPIQAKRSVGLKTKKYEKLP